MYTANHDRLEQMHRQMVTERALTTIADALVGMVADEARFNNKGELQHTELHMTAEEAANALRVIQHILKPLPPGTMTA